MFRAIDNDLKMKRKNRELSLFLMSKSLLPDPSENKKTKGSSESAHCIPLEIMLTCLSFVERTHFSSPDMKNFIFFKN